MLDDLGRTIFSDQDVIEIIEKTRQRGYHLVAPNRTTQFFRNRCRARSEIWREALRVHVHTDSDDDRDAVFGLGCFCEYSADLLSVDVNIVDPLYVRAN